MADQSGAATGGTDSAAVSDKVDPEEKKIPYMIQASINEAGLGLLSWWNSSA